MKKRCDHESEGQNDEVAGFEDKGKGTMSRYVGSLKMWERQGNGFPGLPERSAADLLTP